MPKRKKTQGANAKRKYCEVRPVECDGTCQYAKKKKEGC
jgi:hypothetical protein